MKTKLSKLWILLPVLVLLSSLESHAQAFRPMALTRDLLGTLESYKNFVQSPSFDYKTCAVNINTIAAEAFRLRPEMFDARDVRGERTQIVTASFELRQILVARLHEFYRSGQLRGTDDGCVQAVRKANRYLRHIEDYVLINTSNVPEYKEGKDPKASNVLRGSAPQLLTVDGAPVKIRSGDVLLSRGFAYTSAAIARIGVDEGQFSHLAQIYINAPLGTELTIEQALKDKRVYMIEAHIEVGSFVRSFADYVADGNARVLQFRPRIEASRANAAAKSVYNLVLSYQHKKMSEAGRTKVTVNDNPPYDFKMNNSDASEIFCSEVVAVGYRSAGVKLPTFPTRLKQNGMTRRMEIQVSHSFAPTDMEIEPIFELKAEWRDLRKLPSMTRKDAVLSSMFRWMDDLGYDFQWDALNALKAEIGFTARQLDLGFSKMLPKNMNRQVIAMTFALDATAEALEKEVIKYEQQKMTATGLRSNFPENLAVLESVRRKDEITYRQVDGAQAKFHLNFRNSAWSGMRSTPNN